MKKVKTCISKMTEKQYWPFWFLAIIQLVYHCVMREDPGSDAMWFFRNQLDAYTLKDYLTIRYHVWTSRILIEAVLVYVAKSMVLWKILDWFMWMLFAVSLSVIFGKTEDKYRSNWILVGLILIYPLSELGGAGWIATTTNYIWPLALGTFVFSGTAKVFRGEKIQWWLYLLYIPALLYAANAEQMCAVMLGLEALTILYLIVTKKQGNHWVILLPFLFICIAEFLFIMTCPGNAARKHDEIADYMQNYGTYNLIDKVDLGFVDTLKHLVSSGNLLFLILTVVLAVFVFLRTKESAARLVSIIPVAWTIVLTFFPNVFETQFPQFAGILDKNELINGYNYVWGYSYLPFILYAFITLCILLCIVWIAKSWEEFFVYFCLLAIGLASRVIMGFSPTIFVSGERTFLCLYMMIVVAIAAVIENNREELVKHPKLAQAMELGGACILLVSLFGGFMAASAI